MEHIGTIQSALDEWEESISTRSQIYIVEDADETLVAIHAARQWLSTLAQPVNADGLLPCPWCGSNWVEKNTFEYSDTYFVECHNCMTQGPSARLPTEAIAAWNTRARPQLATQPTAMALEPAAIAALGWIDEIYPPDIFDGSSGDEGPVQIVEIRENLRKALQPQPSPSAGQPQADWSQAAWELSTWAATVHWDGSGNTAE